MADGSAYGPWGPPWDSRAALGKSFRLHKQVPNEKQIDFMRRIDRPMRQWAVRSARTV